MMEAFIVFIWFFSWIRISSYLLKSLSSFSFRSHSFLNEILISSMLLFSSLPELVKKLKQLPFLLDVCFFIFFYKSLYFSRLFYSLVLFQEDDETVVFDGKSLVGINSRLALKNQCRIKHETDMNKISQQLSNELVFLPNLLFFWLWLILVFIDGLPPWYYHDDKDY